MDPARRCVRFSHFGNQLCTDYGVTLGGGGKDTLVRGVWIKNRGFFTWESPL